MQQTAILVLGMHRSGTSALTGVLELLDVYLGSNLMQGTQDNVKGYFENNELFQINEALLAQCDSAWDDVFYNEDKLQNIKNVENLKAIIKKEFEYSKIFAIKDPRLAFLFPIYKKVLDELDIKIKVILPYRNPLEVAKSLNKRDGISMEKGMLLWGYYFFLAEIYSRSCQRVFVGFDELMEKPQESISKISQFLNIDLNNKFLLNQKEIETFLEPSLKHHSIAMDNFSDKVPQIVKKILLLKDEFDKESTIEKFDVLQKEFFGYKKLFYNNEVINSFKELTQTREELTQTKENFTESRRVIEVQNQELEHIKDEYVALYTSKSWRLTKFLRKLKRVFS